MINKRVVSHIFVFLAMLSMVILLGAWAFDNNPVYTDSVAPVQAEDEIKIGFVMNSMLEERWVIEREVFKETVESLGATPLISFGLYDSAAQHNYIEFLMDEGVDTIVVVPQNLYDLRDIMIRVYKQGINIVYYDSLVEDSYADLYLGVDYYSLGQQLAMKTFSSDKNGKVLLLNGTKDNYAYKLMNEGAMDILNENEVILSWIQNANPVEAKRQAGNALLQYQINDVIAPSDVCAGAIIEEGSITNIRVFGIGADVLACERIISEKQTGSMFIPVAEMAYAAANYAVEMAHHRFELPANSQTIENGDFDIPGVFLSTYFVDATNAEDYLQRQKELSQKMY